jgi:hypothetical protein
MKTFSTRFMIIQEVKNQTLYIECKKLVTYTQT